MRALDLRLGDPVHGPRPATCLTSYASQGLLVCPVTLVELAPAFHGDALAARAWLEGMGIGTTEAWTDADTCWPISFGTHMCCAGVEDLPQSGLWQMC